MRKHQPIRATYCLDPACFLAELWLNMGKRQRITIVAVCVVAIVTIAIIIGVTVRRKSMRTGDTDDEAPMVMTDCGPVSGRKVMVNTTASGPRTCYEFINIPFAEPPVGDLRWKRPKLLDGKDPSKCWGGTLAADKDTVRMCSQPTPDFIQVVGEEDCLYLTVRSPNLTGSLPVLVWIHGGGLYEGFGNEMGYSADSEFTVSMDVVAVNFNYRLGIMGFLTMEEIWTTQEPRSYANFGFLDQIAALRWVQRNIARFGGNPNAVTIFGESSGGASILSLMSSPSAEDLFHKAFFTSGVSLFDYDYVQASAINSRRYSAVLGCDQSALEDRRSCLLRKSSSDLVMATMSTLASAWSELLPVPNKSLPLMLAVKDPVVLPFDPANPAEWSRKKKIVVALGNMAEEFALPQFDTWGAVYDLLKVRLDKFNESYTDEVIRLYNVSDAGRVRTPTEVLNTITTDIGVTCSYNRLAKKLSAIPLYEVYRFYVSHQPSSPVRGDNPGRNETLTAAFHGWDMVALFDFQKNRKVFKPTDHDYHLMHELRRTLKALVLGGDMPDSWQRYPTSTASFLNYPPWLRVSEEAIQGRQCDFWDNNGFQRYTWEN